MAVSAAAISSGVGRRPTPYCRLRAHGNRDERQDQDHRAPRSPDGTRNDRPACDNLRIDRIRTVPSANAPALDAVVVIVRRQPRTLMSASRIGWTYPSSVERDRIVAGWPFQRHSYGTA
jgi:hypothetical protein